MDAVEVPVLRPVKKVLQREVEVLRSCREIEKMQLWPLTGTKLRCLWWTGKIASPLSSVVICYTCYIRLHPCLILFDLVRGFEQPCQAKNGNNLLTLSLGRRDAKTREKRTRGYTDFSLCLVQVARCCNWWRILQRLHAHTTLRCQLVDNRHDRHDRCHQTLVLIFAQWQQLKSTSKSRSMFQCRKRTWCKYRGWLRGRRFNFKQEKRVF